MSPSHLIRSPLVYLGLLLGLAAVSPAQAHQREAAGSTSALSAKENPALASAIAAVIDQAQYATARWGIAVKSLDTGHMLYTHDAEKLLQPASTAKLFTAGLTFHSLDVGYRIPTRVLATQAPSLGRLNGPLVLYGMGDPSLGSDSATGDWADQLASQLANGGLHQIDGDLIADDTYFSGPAFGAGWEVSDLLTWFAVPTSALSVNENVAVLKLQPAAAAGVDASLSFDPPQVAQPLSGGIRTSSPHTPANVNFYRAPGDTTLYAFGSVPAQTAVQEYRLALADPAAQASRLLAAALDRHGIRFDGRLRVVHWPEPSAIDTTHALTLAQVSSPPLGELLKRGLKRSQNLYLENLLQLAGVKAQASGVIPDQTSADLAVAYRSSAEWGLLAMRDLLDRAGIAPTSVQLSEGTGLSRRDLVTPQAMVQLLSYLASQPNAQSLQDDMPVAGVDGTLLHRMHGTAAEANLHAKTGSMSYVHCLAGYVTTTAGEHLAFSIMLNNDATAPNATSTATKDVDAIALLLATINRRGG